MEGQIEDSNDDQVAQGTSLCDLLNALDVAALRLHATLGCWPVSAGISDLGSVPKVGRSSVVFVPAPTEPHRASRATVKRARWLQARLRLQRLNHINSLPLCAPQVFRSWSFGFPSLNIKQAWPRGSLKVLYAKASGNRLSQRRFISPRMTINAVHLGI